MERERQEGESGEWSKRGNERKDRNDVEERGRGGVEAVRRERENASQSVLVQTNSTSGSTGDRGEKLLGCRCLP